MTDDGHTTGGVDELLRYVKANASVIKMRVLSAPVIIVLDWDSESRKSSFANLFKPEDPFHVLAWPSSTFNPTLGPSFKGIERHMSDRIVTEADRDLKVVAKKPDGTLVVTPGEYAKLKERISTVVQAGLTLEDILFAKPFLERITATSATISPA